MRFLEIEPADISSLTDADLRELVGRLCEAEISQQGLPTSSVRWGGSQEAPDGGVDVAVSCISALSNPNFVPRANTVFQVKKHSMARGDCIEEMREKGKPKSIIEYLASKKGAYIIVSGKDDCTDKMRTQRHQGMVEAVKDLKCKLKPHLDFYGRDRIASWLRGHPAVSLWVRSRLGKPLTGWKPYCRWATRQAYDDEFLVDEYPCVIDTSSNRREPKPVSEGIQITRDKLREPGSTVRIIGLSGVGKTRFAQALFEDAVGHSALQSKDVIYADIGGNHTPTASDFIAYLISSNLFAYIVLDNCPPEIHRNLQGQIASENALICLLTIEYDISDDKPEETEVIQIEPSSENTVSKLVQKRFPTLGRSNADRIAEFAGGNARVALALANRVNADETLSSFSDESLFQRLFAQKKSQSRQLLELAQALALFYSFNVSAENHGDELTSIADIAGLTRQALYQGQAELLRRQVAQKRGHWRAILPHALANRLAKNALQNYSISAINAELFKPKNLRLLQSCAHRVGYLHDVDQARELALSWMSPNAPLCDISKCDRPHLLVLEHIAPVFPEFTLHAIERASEDKDFTSRSNSNFLYFVRLLCHLAYEDGTFDRAMAILLLFAEGERDGENNNSVVRQMGQFFSTIASGTMATQERRQKFVQKLVTSGNARHREIAGRLLQSVFGLGTSYSIRKFHFGARLRGSGCNPKNQLEKSDWQAAYIKLLLEQALKLADSESNWAKNWLAKHFSMLLWASPECLAVLEHIICQHGRNGEWVKIWIAIKKAIALSESRFDSDMLARLGELQKLTAPTNIKSEVAAYVLEDISAHFDELEVDWMHEKAIELGREVAADIRLLDHWGAEIWETHQQLLWFGRGLARGSKNWLSVLNFIIKSFQTYQSPRSNVMLIASYLSEVSELDPEASRQLLDRILDTPQLRPYAIYLLCSVSIDNWVSTKLLELASSGELEAWRFEHLGLVRLHKAIPDGGFAQLLRAVNKLDKGYLSVIHLFSVRYQDEYIESEEIRTIALDAIRQFVSGSIRQPHNYDLGRASELALNSCAPKRDVRQIISILCHGLHTSRLDASELTDLLNTLIRNHLELLLDTVYGNNDRRTADLLFKDHISEDGPALNNASCSRILLWCGTDQARFGNVARALEIYSTEIVDKNQGKGQLVLSEHIKALIDAATDKIMIVEVIFENAQPRAWSGSLARILEARSKAITELLTYPDPKVRSLVEKKLTELQKHINNARESEIEYQGKLEQRFE